MGWQRVPINDPHKKGDKYYIELLIRAPYNEVTYSLVEAGFKAHAFTQPQLKITKMLHGAPTKDGDPFRFIVYYEVIK